MPEPFARFARSDLGRRLPRLVAWVDHWGPVITIALAAIMATVALGTGIAVFVSLRTQSDLAQTAREQCNRTKRLAPKAVRDQIHRGVYRGSDAAYALSTIPKRCP